MLSLILLVSTSIYCTTASEVTLEYLGGYFHIDLFYTNYFFYCKVYDEFQSWRATVPIIGEVHVGNVTIEHVIHSKGNTSNSNFTFVPFHLFSQASEVPVIYSLLMVFDYNLGNEINFSVTCLSTETRKTLRINNNITVAAESVGGTHGIYFQNILSTEIIRNLSTNIFICVTQTGRQILQLNGTYTLYINGNTSGVIDLIPIDLLIGRMKNLTLHGVLVDSNPDTTIIVVNAATEIHASCSNGENQVSLSSNLFSSTTLRTELLETETSNLENATSDFQLTPTNSSSWSNLETSNPENATSDFQLTPTNSPSWSNLGSEATTTDNLNEQDVWTIVAVIIGIIAFMAFMALNIIMVTLLCMIIRGQTRKSINGKVEIQKQFHMQRLPSMSHPLNGGDTSHPPNEENISYIPNEENTSHPPNEENTSHQPSEGNTSHLPNEENCSHQPSEENTFHLPYKENTSHPPNEENASYPPSEENTSHPPNENEESGDSHLESTSSFLNKNSEMGFTYPSINKYHCEVCEKFVIEDSSASGYIKSKTRPNLCKICLYRSTLPLTDVKSKDSKPTIRELTFLKIGNENLKIIETASCEWTKIGTLLDFDDLGSRISIIKRETTSLEDCLIKVFQLWLTGESRKYKPASWRTLTNILMDSGFSTTANLLDDLFN